MIVLCGENILRLCPYPIVITPLSTTFKPLLTTSTCIKLNIMVAKCWFSLTIYIYLLTFQHREEISHLFLNLISIVSWIPILFIGLSSVTIIMSFDIWICPRCGQWEPYSRLLCLFDTYSLFFERFLTFWPQNMFLPYLVLSLPQLWNQLFIQEVVVLRSGLSLLAGCHHFSALST